MMALLPANTAPTGAPNPLERSIQTVSTCVQISLVAWPLATTAFISRAPSICTGIPYSSPTALISASRSSGQILPPPLLDVFSTQISVVPTVCVPSPVISARTCSAVKIPCSPGIAFTIAPAKRAAPPPSEILTWALFSITTASPGLICAVNAIRLHIVPEGRKSAASLPVSSATNSCSALTVGSVRNCSSPTSASAIALRIPADGRVAVSLERSITPASSSCAKSGRHTTAPIVPPVSDRGNELPCRPECYDAATNRYERGDMKERSMFFQLAEVLPAFPTPTWDLTKQLG